MTGLPRGYSLRHSHRTKASAAAVLDKVRRPGTWPDWVPEITSMDASGQVDAGTHVSGRARMLGFAVDGRSHISEVSASSFEQDVVVGVRMIARYEVESTPEGTIVHHELVVSPPRGALGRVLAILLRGRLKAMQRRLLRNLVAEVEHRAAVESSQVAAERSP